MQFKIRSLMIAVGAIALLLAAATDAGVLAASFLASCVALSGGLWWAFRDYRRLSALGLGLAAAVTNAVCFMASIALSLSAIASLLITPLMCVLGTPVIFGFGAAWCTAAARTGPVPARSRTLMWALAVGLSIAPLTMSLTYWPFRLAFLASRPSLERLADRVAAGVPVNTPEWAGAFRVVGSVVNPESGTVALITNPSPIGRGGFERLGDRARTPGPFYNVSLDLELNEKWRYAEED